MRTLRDIARWLVASVATLAALETLLVALRQPFYTDLTRALRRSPHRLVRLIPVLAAIVVVLHLEEKLPRRWDPFSRATRLFRR